MINSHSKHQEDETALPFTSLYNGKYPGSKCQLTSYKPSTYGSRIRELFNL
jgi:hypothetical protein